MVVGESGKDADAHATDGAGDVHSDASKHDPCAHLSKCIHTHKRARARGLQRQVVYDGILLVGSTCFYSSLSAEQTLIHGILPPSPSPEGPTPTVDIYLMEFKDNLWMSSDYTYQSLLLSTASPPKLIANYTVSEKPAEHLETFSLGSQPERYACVRSLELARSLALSACALQERHAENLRIIAWAATLRGVLVRYSSVSLPLSLSPTSSFSHTPSSSNLSVTLPLHLSPFLFLTFSFCACVCVISFWLSSTSPSITPLPCLSLREDRLLTKNPHSSSRRNCHSMRTQP